MSSIFGDSGFVPEHELSQMLAQLHERGQNTLDQAFPGWPARPPWLHTPLEPTPENFRMLMQETRSPRVERRYWALRELMNGHETLTGENLTQLAALLKDPSVDIRLQAIQLLVTKGRYDQIAGDLEEALAHPYAWARTVALGIVESMPPGMGGRYARAVENVKEGGYAGMLRPYLLKRLKTEAGKTGNPPE